MIKLHGDCQGTSRRVLQLGCVALLNKRLCGAVLLNNNTNLKPIGKW